MPIALYIRAVEIYLNHCRRDHVANPPRPDHPSSSLERVNEQLYVVLREGESVLAVFVIRGKKLDRMECWPPKQHAPRQVQQQ
jgi:hypothetical protein